MKKKAAVICVMCIGLLCAGCTENASDAEQPDGIQVMAAENLDPDYTACITDYFNAINDSDFAAYNAVIYPPYQTAYSAYLEAQGSSLEAAFQDMCHRFDEDGYESWELTEMTLQYYSSEPEDLTDFFSLYTQAGILDEQFVTDCKAEAEEMRDVVFTLSALYEGDEAAVLVVPNGEIIVIKTAEGTYLFG